MGLLLVLLGARLGLREFSLEDLGSPRRPFFWRPLGGLLVVFRFGWLLSLPFLLLFLLSFFFIESQRFPDEGGQILFERHLFCLFVVARRGNFFALSLRRFL
jgi:hypothetical protein